MTTPRALLLSLILTISIAPSLKAQTKKSRQLRQLEKQRTEQLKRIEHTDKKIKELKKNKANEQQQIKLVRKRIEQKEQLIGILNSEVSSLQQQIDSLGGQLTILGGKERRLIDQYRISLRSMQRTERDTDLLLFLFSASSLDEVMRRQLFVSRYTCSSREILDSLLSVRLGLQETKTNLGEHQTEKKKLVELRDKEKQELTNEEGRRRAQVQKFQSEQSKLEAQLRKAQQQARQLEQRIEQQIAAEIKRAEEQARKAREARRKQAEAARKSATSPKPTIPRPSRGTATRSSADATTPSSKSKEATSEIEERRADTRGGYAMDSAERNLAGSFRQNKGRLPMPIRGRYQLVYRFGRQPHETLKHVQIVKGGVDLRAMQDRHAYAVFAGTVSSVLVTSGYETSVILRHGNYLTVYSNLSHVSVRNGQKVKAGQALGTIATPPGESHALLHFQLWYEQRNQDPWPWLKK